MYAQSAAVRKIRTRNCDGSLQRQGKNKLNPLMCISRDTDMLVVVGKIKRETGLIPST